MKSLHGCLAILSLFVGTAMAQARPPTIDVATSEDHAVDGGTWRSTIRRTAQPWACGSKREATTCVENTVLIDNRSPQTLECFGGFGYTSPEGVPINDPDLPALVLPRTRHEMRGRTTTADTRFAVASLECRARPTYVRIKVADGCKYEMHGDPLENYYPAAALGQSFEGPVTLSFVLAQKNGPATEVAVADSSLIPVLDAAARRFIGDQNFVTNCPGTRFDMRMRFKLRDRYSASAGG